VFTVACRIRPSRGKPTISTYPPTCL